MLVLDFTTPPDLTLIADSSDAWDFGIMALSDRFVYAGMADLTPSEGGKRMVIDGESSESEFLALRAIVALTGNGGKVFSLEDEAGFDIAPTGTGVAANLEPLAFLEAVSVALGQVAGDPDAPAEVGERDQLLDWAALALRAAGLGRQNGYGDFDRHRMTVQSQTPLPFEQSQPVARNGEVKGWHAIAFPDFAIILERKPDIKGGGFAWLGYVYFWRPYPVDAMDGPQIAEWKISLLRPLGSENTPWFASDIRQRSINIKEQGGAWLQSFDWVEDRVNVTDEFFQ